MASAIGDLVVNLALEDIIFQDKIKADEKSLKQFASSSETSMSKAGGSIRNAGGAFNFLGREVSTLGIAVSQVSSSTGEYIAGVGSSISAIGLASKSVTQLGKAYQWLTTQQIISKALSGPAGWIALAGGLAAAGGAFYYLKGGASEAANELKRAEEAGKLLAGKLSAEYGSNQQTSASGRLSYMSGQRRSAESDVAAAEKERLEALYSSAADHAEKYAAAVEKLANAKKLLAHVSKMEESARIQAGNESGKQFVAELDAKIKQIGMTDKQIRREKELNAVREMERNANDKLALRTKTLVNGELVRETPMQKLERKWSLEDQQERLAAEQKDREALVEKGTQLGKTSSAYDEYLNKIKALQEAYKANTITLDELHAAQQRAAAGAGLIFDTEKIAQFNNSLKTTIETFGLTGRQRQIKEMELAGARPEDLRESRSLDAQLTAMEKRNKLAEEGKHLTEQMKSPYEKYQDQVAKYKDMYRAGDISKDTYDRAIAAAGKPLSGGPSEKSITELPRALEARSDDAWKKILDAMRPAEDPQKDIAFNTKRAADRLDQIANREPEEVDLPA